MSSSCRFFFFFFKRTTDTKSPCKCPVGAAVSLSLHHASQRHRNLQQTLSQDPLSCAPPCREIQYVSFFLMNFRTSASVATTTAHTPHMHARELLSIHLSLPISHKDSWPKKKRDGCRKIKSFIPVQNSRCLLLASHTGAHCRGSPSAFCKGLQTSRHLFELKLCHCWL